RDPAAADAGFGAAGDALLQVLPGRPGDRACQLGQRVRVDQAAHQELRALLQQAGGTAAGIGGDPAARQLGRCRVDAEVGQDHAVHHAHVPGSVPQPDPAPGRGPVQGIPVRMAAELVLVVAGPDHPLPRRRRLGPPGDRRVQLIQAADRGRADVDLAERHAEPDHVIVRVVEPGQHGRAAQVGDACRAGRYLVQGSDQAMCHGHGGGPRPVRVHGQHVGVDQHEVSHGPPAAGAPDQDSIPGPRVRWMSTYATDGCRRFPDLLPSVADIQRRERMLMSGLVIEREVLIEAPAEVVWRTITEPDQITQWFASRVELVVEPGAHGYMEFGDQGGPVVVEAVDPPTRFSFRWNHPRGEEPVAGNSMLVEFTLTPEGDEQTRLRVVESGHELCAWPDAEKERYAEEHQEGWVEFLDRLAVLVAKRRL